MKKVLIAFLCTGVMVCSWAAPKKSAAVKWQNDLQSAQKSLKGAKKKHILLFFTAPGWCGPCRMLESGAVATPAFAKLVQKNAAVRADFSDRQNVPESAKKLMSTYRVQGFPTMIVLDINGREKGRIVGYRPEKKFFAELKKLMK